MKFSFDAASSLPAGFDIDVLAKSQQSEKKAYTYNEPVEAINDWSEFKKSHQYLTGEEYTAKIMAKVKAGKAARIRVLPANTLAVAEMMAGAGFKPAFYRLKQDKASGVNAVHNLICKADNGQTITIINSFDGKQRFALKIGHWYADEHNTFNVYTPNNAVDTAMNHKNPANSLKEAVKILPAALQEANETLIEWQNKPFNDEKSGIICQSINKNVFDGRLQTPENVLQGTPPKTAFEALVSAYQNTLAGGLSIERGRKTRELTDIRKLWMVKRYIYMAFENAM